MTSFFPVNISNMFLAFLTKSADVKVVVIKAQSCQHLFLAESQSFKGLSLFFMDNIRKFLFKFSVEIRVLHSKLNDFMRIVVDFAFKLFNLFFTTKRFSYFSISFILSAVIRAFDGLRVFNLRPALSINRSESAFTVDFYFSSTLHRCAFFTGMTFFRTPVTAI